MSEGSEKHTLLKVFYYFDSNHKPVVDWEFSDTTNAYFLLGVLDTVKDDLLLIIDEANYEKED